MSPTARQLEILCLYSKGLRRRDAAAVLHLSPRTVDNQLRDIQRRLQTRSTSHSIVVALCRGELVLDSSTEAVVVPERLAAV